jgi:hypothetical protein
VVPLTELKVYTDRKEYSRFEPSRRVVKVRVVPTPATGLTGESVRVAICRHDGAELAFQTITLTGDYPKGIIVSFDLEATTDADGFPVCIRGDYSIIATSGDVTGSALFHIAVITVDELKASYCVGLPLRAREVLMPKKQPSLVTGVVVDRVSPDLSPGLHILKFKVGTPNTLQLDGGPLVQLVDGISSEIVPDERGHYLEVSIDAFELPGADCIEALLIDREVMSDDVLRGDIEKAVSEVERLLGTFIEPQRMATDPFFRNPAAGEYFDRRATPATFYRREVFPDVAKTWHISLPYTHIQKVYYVEGRFGEQKSMSINNGIYKINVMQGTLDVLPQTAEFAYIVNFFSQLDYWGTREYIADFWRYKALVGLVQVEPDLLKLVGYKAAIAVLTVAGQAARGGYSSESISKDGVSRSTSVSQGLYGDTIKVCQDWITANSRNVANRYRGINMVVL